MLDIGRAAICDDPMATLPMRLPTYSLSLSIYHFSWLSKDYRPYLSAGAWTSSMPKCIENWSCAKKRILWSSNHRSVPYKCLSLYRTLCGLTGEPIISWPGLPGWRLSAGCTFRTETPAVRGATRLPCTTSEQYIRWPFLRCRRPAHMEWVAVQPTRHWTITDYFQWTSENILILRRVLRPRRICDIYDLFAPFINVLIYLYILSGLVHESPPLFVLVYLVSRWRHWHQVAGVLDPKFQTIPASYHRVWKELPIATNASRFLWHWCVTHSTFNTWILSK